MHDKSTAYSVSGVFECEGKSVDDVNIAIGLLVDKHPILKGRVLDTGDLPLLVCDGYPAVEIVDVDDYSHCCFRYSFGGITHFRYCDALYEKIIKA